MEIFLFATASILFGFTTDFADLLDEHGLKWFKFSDIIFGALWGLFGAYIIFTNAPAGIFVIALVLYWLSRGKLDYPNHILAGVIIFLSAFWFFSYSATPLIYVIIPFVVCFLIGHFGSYLKNHYKISGNLKIVNLIKHFIPPISLTIILGNFFPIYFFLLSMTGSKISDRWFENFVRTGHSGIAEILGMSLRDDAHN